VSILLISILVLASVILFATKRNRETGLILGLCLSLGLHWFTVLIYIAKKGGIDLSMQTLLFLTREIRHALQYLLVTLSQLGYVMAVGRYLTPLFLLWLGLYYSMDPAIRRRRNLYAWAAALPGLSLIVYHPAVFEWLITLAPWMLQALVNASLAWIILYLVITVVLLVREYRSISMPFYRVHYRSIFIMLLSLAILYVLYMPQDPAQVYLFYRNEYMGTQQGLWYLNPALSMTNYILAMGAVLLCSAIGFTSLVRFTRDNIREGQEEIAIQRKFDAASNGVSVFVHSVKNQLLANRVLLKRLNAALDQPEPDLAKLREYQHSLAQSNEMMLERISDLYQGVRSKSITLVPESLHAICQAAIERFARKYPEAKVKVSLPEDLQILCDKVHIAEALYNLLTNGWEAQLAAGREDAPLTLAGHQERMWTVLEITDQGLGLTPAQRRHIFEPFYSNKNTNTNWGMGLYYVRAITRSHLGVLRVESTPGKGSSFFLQLPRYQG